MTFSLAVTSSERVAEWRMTNDEKEGAVSGSQMMAENVVYTFSKQFRQLVQFWNHDTSVYEKVEYSDIYEKAQTIPYFHPECQD